MFDPWGLYYKTFYSRNFTNFCNNPSTFQALHSRVSSWPYPKTRLERLAMDKQSSSLQKSVNYGPKKFYSTGLRLVPLR
jgi:hypothetical protein